MTEEMTTKNAAELLLGGFISATSEIGTQRAENTRLRAALEAIREQGYVLGLGSTDWPVKDAEEALAPR